MGNLDRVERINKIMYEFGSIKEEGFRAILKGLEPKIIRWMATHHPDNKTRRLLLSNTNVTIGDGSVINMGITVSDNYLKLVTIGKRVAISPNVTIVAVSAPNNSRLTDNPYVKSRLIRQDPVEIEDDCWIGAGAIILPGVTIGEKSIIGAGAVVTRDIPPNRIAAGVPCTVKRKL